ncbi:MAG: hypothetical protein M1142_03705 [Patescibacteria group bacterium]|nr:hypothetical protein [Patescibacteria group bacterium]
MSALKKSTFFLLLIFSVFLGTLLPKQALALDADTRNPNCKNGGCPLNVSNFNEKVNMDNSLQSVVHGGLCMLAGTSPYNDCLVYQKDSKTGASIPTLFAQVPSMGALGAVTGLTLALYTPPTSSIDYLASIGENMGIGPKSAYAQSVTGSGEGIIKPVLKLWQAARNIAYLAFILIFVVIGLMVMFRQKINPQTVISIQTALPGLVVGLVLVTFSYFIAALLVDTSFIGMRLITEVFINSGVGNAFGNADNLRRLADNSNIFQLFSSSAGVVWSNNANVGNSISSLTQSIWAPLAEIIPAIIGAIIGFFTMGGLGILLGGIGGGVVGGADKDLVPNMISGILSLILIIALFIQMFRLLFGLIGTYIQILIATISGPLIILISSIPGRTGGLGNWIKSLLANALVFPAVFAMFLFAGVILGGTTNSDWKVSPPLFGNMQIDLLRALLAYGILLATPIIPDTIRKAFNVKGPEGFDKAALGGFMGGWGTFTGGIGRGYGTAMRSTGLAYRQQALQKQRLQWAQDAGPQVAADVGWRERIMERLPGVK